MRISAIALNHSHICTLYDVGPNYLVMELVEGESLAARLKSGPLPLKTALLYTSRVAEALAEAHAKGIVHRDLKPGNIMIAKSGVKVLDFGLAKSGPDESVTASHNVMGTPACAGAVGRQTGRRAVGHLFIRLHPLRDADGTGAQRAQMRAPSQRKEPAALCGARLTPRPPCAASSVGGSRRRRIPSKKLEKL